MSGQAKEEEPSKGEESEAKRASVDASRTRARPVDIDDPRLEDDGDDEVPEELPRMLTNRYRLESLLATGGMGRVYLATQLPLERRVAIKLLVAPPHLKGDFRKRFLLEASVCAKLTHPNIVVVHDYGESDQGGLFMAMELLEGRSLSQVLKEDGPLPPLRVTRIALQIARALRQAHRGGVAHRDLKPGNVFLERHLTDADHEDEIVKVLDFGLVKVFEESRPDVERDLTQGGMMMGSPRYMSPEQITCEEVDARSDIYSLGALIHALVCGRPPFVGGSTIEVLTQHLQADPPTFEQTFRDTEQAQHYPAPPELQAIVHRCLRKEKVERYQSIDDLIRDLKVVIALHGDAVESTSTSVSMPRLDPGTIPFETHPTPTPLPIDALPPVSDAPPTSSSSIAPKLVAVGLAIVVAAVVALLWPKAEELPVQTPPVAAAEPEEPVEPVEPELVEPTVEETPPPAAPELVRVVVTSEPSGAEVMTGGVLIGRTPVTHDFPPTAGDARRVFDLTLDGHRAARVSRALEGEEVAITVRLEADAPRRTESTTTRTPRTEPAVMQATAPPTMEATMEAATEPPPTMESRVVRDTPRVPIVD